MVGRREQLRRELLASVRTAALAHLQEDGPSGLSLRAVARDVGISPAGLYRYFDGRDALLTMLISEGYDDLADHLFLAQGLDGDDLSDLDRPRDVPHAVVSGADPVAHVEAAWRTYRDWGRGRPNEFALLFGEPIAGYAAPQEGSTTRANARMSMALMRPMLEAEQAGRLRVPALVAPSAGHQVLAEAISEVAGVAILPSFAAFALASWSQLHGAVALELNGQFHWMDPEGIGDVFDASLAAHLRNYD